VDVRLNNCVRPAGYKEPYNSVGFPGFNYVMKDTPNTGG